MDSDDLWKPEKLEFHVKFLEEHPSAGGVFSDLELVRGASLVDSMLKTYPIFSDVVSRECHDGTMTLSRHSLYVCLLEEMPVKLQALTLRHDCVLKVGSFEESWKSGEDWEFILRFVRTNALGYIDRALTVQRIMPDSTLIQYQKLDAARRWKTAFAKSSNSAVIRMGLQP